MGGKSVFEEDKQYIFLKQLKKGTNWYLGTQEEQQHIELEGESTIYSFLSVSVQNLQYELKN